MKVSFSVHCVDSEGRGAVASMENMEMNLAATDPVNADVMADFRPHGIGSWEIHLPNGSVLAWSALGWGSEE